MTKNIRKTCIIGAGGFGREVFCCLMDSLVDKNLKVNNHVCFMVEDQFLASHKILGIDVIPISKFDPLLYEAVVAIGNPVTRKRIVESLPAETIFATIIHPNTTISEWVEIGEGAIITSGVTITCNIKIGKHAQLNLNTTIGHDCIIGDYFTTAPGVNISGNCNFGEGVYFGTNSAVREGVSICDGVTIGMGGIVLRDISESGIYVGSPVKKMGKN